MFGFVILVWYVEFVCLVYLRLSSKDLYQVLLGVYLCQRWIVEFKGIMRPVLFMIFFSDFVTPQKAICLKVVGYLL